MSCPICGPHCRCAEPRTYEPVKRSRTDDSRSVILEDVDAYDPSEEQFASSLAGRESREDQEIASGTLAGARARLNSVLPDIDVESAQASLLPTDPEPPESWREEVSSRIQSYKAKRRRSLGDESLSFNFESTAANHVFLRPEREPEPESPVSQVAYDDAVDSSLAYYSHPYATAPAIEPQFESTQDYMDHPSSQSQVSEPLPATPPLPPAPPETAKLIFFPKPPMMEEPPVNQLADPVFDVPRILEAPEETETVTVPLADITLHPDPDAVERCIPHVETLELPVPVAPVAQRVFAEVVDIAIALFATGIFGYVVSHLGGSYLAGDKRTVLELSVAVPALFWSIYKYMFLVHGGTTLGLQVAQLQLLSFEGQRPMRAPRRYRALALLVSAFPLGLGLLWSFVDAEALCWHDRISRTYVTARRG